MAARYWTCTWWLAMSSFQAVISPMAARKLS
jgi:hypothetical protein